MSNIQPSGRGVFFILLTLMLISPFSPMADHLIEEVEASSVARHIYEFHDGSSEYVALFQGANPDAGAKVTIPKGAKVTDVTMTLSGASATGWSTKIVDDKVHWMQGTDSNTDSRSGDLSLALDSPEQAFFAHGFDEEVNPNSDAWLDNGSFAIRQPHTSNASETRFSSQVKQTSSSLMAQGQGAVLKNHDWLFLSTFTSQKFDKIVTKLYPNNASRHSTITLDKANCILPQLYSSTYYGKYGFIDWTLTDDERMFGILAGYNYPYGSSIPTQYLRLMEMDVSRDDVWTCLDSYDLSPSYGDYTGIAYDRESGDFWVVHNNQRRIVSYDFDQATPGQYERGDDMYSFSSSSGTVWECGTSGQSVRGLEVNSTSFFMRCQKGSYHNDKDTLEAWSISGSSSSLIPQAGTVTLSAKGYGLHFDGSRFITADTGYSSWSSNTLYYREVGTGWVYETTPAPGTTTWYGPTTTSVDPIVAANIATYSSAASIGDRVDYWVSADNGTHWESVESNSTIHFAYPGTELVWKATLIGSTAVSWWVDVEYATEYTASGDWTSKYYKTGTKVGKVRPVWQSTEPTGTSVSVSVSNDNGSTWLPATNGQETSFSSEGAGDTLRFAIMLSTTDTSITPTIDSFDLNYEEGYPDRPQIDIGNDNVWDWESLLFLNESSVIASDDSEVGVEVKYAPTLIDAFNEHIPENGDGFVEVPIGIKAASNGRVKISNLDVSYKLQTRAISASLEGGLVAPDGIYRNLVIKVSHGDDYDRVSKTLVALNNSHGENPSFTWALGNSCSTMSDGGELVTFDTANCTSSIDANDVLSITMPMMVNWSWDDEAGTEAIITVEDDSGEAVSGWESDNFGLVVENDIQLDGLRVWEETGRELYSFDWVRGGFNLSFSGGIHFQDSSLSPEAGQFSIRILGQNVTHDGVPIGQPEILADEVNPAFGEYNITLVAPMESSPGGMVFYVEAVNLTTGSTYANPGYNTIRLVLDGNSPLVIYSTPEDGVERHAAPPGSGQGVEIGIQDSVDPPNQITLHYWIGCKAGEALGCTDYNFDGLPNEDEYEMTSVSSPETRTGGMNIFQGSIDDSMLLHGQKVSYYVSGKDGQNNQIAMGGGPVCPSSSVACGTAPGEFPPDWNADLGTYKIRQEFEPQLDPSNSTIIGHDDYEPLHPGIPYTAQITLSDRNGWQDIQYVQLALGGDYDDDSTSIFITLAEGLDGNPQAVMTSGSSNIAVSNLYSSVSIDENNNSIIRINARFQLTWTFPESFDTDGAEGTHVLPRILVTDKPCNDGEITPCYEAFAGLSDDWWSLDNDFRFDTMQGHIRAVELRDGTNHYTDDAIESLIGAGQALRVSGRVLFSEDELPAPAGAFDVVFGDYDHTWITSTRENGEFSLDLLVPSVRSGRLDLSLNLDDLPGYALDETHFTPRVRFAVDSEAPSISEIQLNEVKSGGQLSIGDANDLLIQLETEDDHGFDLTEPAVVHYRVRAGEAEISRGSVPLLDTTQFGEIFFWTGSLDLTDNGATTLLQSYVVDVWVSGSDEAGNPFDSDDNAMLEPFGTWSLALLGPSIDLQASDSETSWSNPSPIESEAVNMNVQVRNVGGRGDVAITLQRLVDGGFWAEESTVELEAGAGLVLNVALPTVADVEAGERIEFRVLVLVDGVEMDRKVVDPLIVKEETVRGGEALSQQASDSQLAIILYIIAIFSVVFALQSRFAANKMREEMNKDESDQTDEVVAEMNDSKSVPAIDPNLPPPPGLNPLPPPPGLNPQPPAPEAEPAVEAEAETSEDAGEADDGEDANVSGDPRGAPPVPPTGLPEGWTQDQWDHFGWQYIDAMS